MFFKKSRYIIFLLFILIIKGSCTNYLYCNNLINNSFYKIISRTDKPVPEIYKEKKHPSYRKKLLERRPPWFLPNADFAKPVILIYILTIVIMYSILSIIIMLVFMVINRGKRDKRNQLINLLKEKYQTALVEYLEHKKENTELMAQIKKIANSTFTREILIDEMIDLSINLQKKQAEELRSLFFDLKLNEDSLLKLTSKYWHERIKGFKECAFMNIQESQPIIEKRLNCKNEIERSEAQLAQVRLNTEDPYSFLDNLKRPFSVWEQNIVHQEIIYHNLNIPEFERWCNSENDSIKKFSSKMVQLFEQKRAWGKLVELLKDKNEKIRASAIESLGNLRIKKTQAYLKEQYQYENDDNKLLIITALSKFKNIHNLVFFKHIIEEEDKNVWLQVEAAKGIREIGVDGKKELNGLLDSEEYRNYQIVVKHVLNERL